MGSLRTSSPLEILDGEGFRALRHEMLKGKPITACEGCYRDERIGTFSLRRWANERFQAPGRPDAGVEAGSGPRYLHLSFSNVCDYRCRICNPQLSSSWYQDIGAIMRERHGVAPRQAVLRPSGADEDFLRKLEPCLDSVETIHFSSAGEPLIAEGHYLLLERLIERKLFHVELVYNTNFGTLTHAGRDVLKLWDRFEKVFVTASLDAMGRRGEYIRKGQDWAATVANRERMLREGSRACFAISPTVSLFNALHVPDLHRDWVERGYIDVDALNLNALQQPPFYSVQMLPAAFKAKVAARYRDYCAELERLGEGGHKAASLFAGISAYMNEADLGGWLESFREATQTLDRLRGERFAEVFPELSGLL